MAAAFYTGKTKTTPLAKQEQIIGVLRLGQAIRLAQEIPKEAASTINNNNNHHHRYHFSMWTTAN